MTLLRTLGTVFIIFTFGYIPNVQTKPLVVTSLRVRPFLIETKDYANGTVQVTYEGYIPDLLDEIAKLINISYELSVRADSKYGHMLPNGSWDGLIGDVVEGLNFLQFSPEDKVPVLRERADMAAGPLTETASRSRVVDFSTPFMNFGPVIILKRPQAPVMTLKERLQRLFAPLSQSIWMMSGLAWMVTSVILYIICHVDPYDWRRLAKDKQATLREGESFSCLNTFWFTMSNVLWQGYTISPRSLGARIVVTFWWLYVLIFVVMYISSMTNYLRVGPMQNVNDFYTDIQNVEDLGKQKVVNYGVIQEGATEQYLQSAKIPQIKQVWTMINRHNMYVGTLEKAINKVRTSRKPFAFIAESAMAKYFTKQSPCDIYMVGDFITIGSYSLAVRASSHLTKQLDIALLTLRERGVLKELDDRWFSGECTGFVVETSNKKMQIPPFYGVDLGTFSGALLILCFGLIIGSIAAGVEIIVFKFAERGDQEKSDVRQPLTASAPNKEREALQGTEPEPVTDV